MSWNLYSLSLVVLLLLIQCFFTPITLSESLIGSRESCSNEGGEVSVHSIKDMRCFSCMCKNGFVECQRRGCPSQQGCYMLLEQEREQCCQQCKGCQWDGVERPSGSEWTHEDDPCRVFKCLGGVITETKMVCHTPCDSLVPAKKGQCCPSCKGCLINGQEVGADRDAMILDDPCLKCHCREDITGAGVLRSMTCTKVACPVLQCPVSNQFTVSGECCPTCKGSRPHRMPPKNRCVLVTELRYEGETFSQEVSNPVGRPPISIPSIPPSTLLSDQGIDKSTDISAKGTTVKAPAVDDLGISPGNCTKCTCGRNGTINCLRRTCPVLECPVERRVWPIVVDEATGLKHKSCCMKCIEESAEARRQCSHNGKIYKEGERWALDPCRSCVCSSGSVRCAMEMCPAVGAVVMTSKGQHQVSTGRMAKPNIACPPNTRLYHPKGTCCPTCVESDGVCSVFGDPHYRTFDGRFYSFQGSCKYLLTSDHCGAHSPPLRNQQTNNTNNSMGQQQSKNHGTFSIRVTNDARGTFTSSWTKTISIKAHGLKVSLGQKMRVKLNGKRVQLPLILPAVNSSKSSPDPEKALISVKKEGGGVILWMKPGIVIIWDGNSFLEVSMPPIFKNKLCGLCGNYNNDPKDDLTPKAGSTSSLKGYKPNGPEKGNFKKFANSAPNHARAGNPSNAALFASSWRVGGKKACSRSPDSDVRMSGVMDLKRIGPASSLPANFPPLSPPVPFPGLPSMWGAATLCRGGGGTVLNRGALERRRKRMRARFRKCRALRSPLFSVCHDKVNPTMYMRSCLSDLCECPKGVKCHCASLKAYAHACRRAMLLELPAGATDDEVSSSPFSLPPQIRNWRNFTGCLEDNVVTSMQLRKPAVAAVMEVPRGGKRREEDEEERRRRRRRRRKRKRRRKKRKRLEEERRKESERIRG